MKKLLYFVLFAAFIGLTMPSCSRGTGCPAESAQTKTDRAGNPKGGTKHHLFSKKRIQKKQKQKKS